MALDSFRDVDEGGENHKTREKQKPQALYPYPFKNINDSGNDLVPETPSEFMEAKLDGNLNSLNANEMELFDTFSTWLNTISKDSQKYQAVKNVLDEMSNNSK